MGKRRYWMYLWILVIALVWLLPAGIVAADQEGSGQQTVLGKVCTTEEEAARVMREHMVKRQEVFIIPVKMKVEGVTGAEDRNSELDKVMDRIHNLALAETDKPYEGDYLSQAKGYNQLATGVWKDDVFTGTFEFFCPLMSTAAQEKAVNAIVIKILKELALNGKSEYEKIRAIYDYLCSHTRYDEEGSDTDVAYTAYSVLVKGRGTCYAYSMAAYRLMREAGIGCRTINVISKDQGAGHAWNIVRIGKLWYYVDATWDTSLYQAKLPYKYFLKGSKDGSYVDHESFERYNPGSEPDFWKKHPLSPTDYLYRDSGLTPAPKPSGGTAPNVPNVPGVPIIVNRSGGLVLTWKAVGNAVSYDVLRSVNGGQASTIARTRNTSFIDRKVISGNTYTYYLIANGSNGYKTRRSNPKSFYYLSAPRKLKINVLRNRMLVLTWERIRGAEGYHIQYSYKENMNPIRKVVIRKGYPLIHVIRNLGKGKYYFQIRSYQTRQGRKVYSDWSPKMSVTIN